MRILKLRKLVTQSYEVVKMFLREEQNIAHLSKYLIYNKKITLKAIFSCTSRKKMYPCGAIGKS